MTMRASRFDRQGPARRPLSRTTLAETVYDALFGMLLDEELGPGDPVNIDSVSRDLGVSPTPVREALARLESLGFLTREALKGYRVAPPLSAREFDSLMETRGLLESALARHACERADDAFLATLDETIVRQEGAQSGPDYEVYRDFLRADEAFHDAITVQADNRFLARALESLSGHAHRFRLFEGRGVEDAEQSLGEHREIVAAFQAASPERAAEAMASHIAGVRERGLREIEESAREARRDGMAL